MNPVRILLDAGVIAIVGCSADSWRTSNRIARYLMLQDYRIVPVNPNHEEVLGETCYPDLMSVPADAGIDIVNIFRNPRYTEAMVRDAVALSEATGTQPLIWTQLGVSTPAARETAERARLPYVANRCIMVEHARAVDS